MNRECFIVGAKLLPRIVIFFWLRFRAVKLYDWMFEIDFAEWNYDALKMFISMPLEKSYRSSVFVGFMSILCMKSA